MAESLSWIAHFRHRRHRKRQDGFRHRGAGQFAVELRQRPGGHELGAGVHLSSAPRCQEAVGKEKLVQLWLKRLKHAALDISHMLEDYQDNSGELKAKVPTQLVVHASAHHFL